MTDSERSNPTQKQGVINKCPNCGGPLKAFASRCDLCGHELAGVSASRVVTDLVQKFNDIEAALAASGMSGSKLEKELIARKARVIRDFPIPNAREDLQSLIYFIHPKIQDNIKPDPNAEDWRVKFTEVLNLAKNAYKGDARTRQEFEEIERSLNVSLSGVLHTRAKRSPFMALGVGTVAVLCVLGFASTQWDGWKLKQCEEKYQQGALSERQRLEGIRSVANDKLQAKDFAGASSLLNGLRWEYQESCKADDAAQEKTTWENKRAELAAQIQKAENEVQEKQREVARQEVEQQRAEADRELAKKRAIVEQAEVRRVAEGERDLADRLRQRSAARKAMAD